MVSFGGRYYFIIVLMYLVMTTPRVTGAKFETFFRDINGKRIWTIRVHIQLPVWLTSPKYEPSFWYINKGICPPSLCAWNERDGKYKPTSGLEKPFFQGDIVLDDAFSYLHHAAQHHQKHTEPTGLDRHRNRRATSRHRNRRATSRHRNRRATSRHRNRRATSRHRNRRATSRHRNRRATPRHRNRRATSRNPRLWSGGRVPFVIDDKFDPYTKTLVTKAMRHIENKTCVRFAQKTPRDVDYLLFINEPGCWSYIGRVGGPQKICLGEGCEYFGTAVHEISHALGFWHEQSRSDRDEYVEIVTENIIKAYLEDFSKIPMKMAVHRGFPYDYGSIMHYKSHTYTRNTNITIRVIGPGKELGLAIGQRDGLSNLDIAQFNSMYRCNVKDDKKESVCQTRWVKYGRGCYLFVASPKHQYNKASRYCLKRNSNLVTITSRSQDKFLKSYLKSHWSNSTLTWRTSGKISGGKIKWYDAQKKEYYGMKFEEWSAGHPGAFTSHALVWNSSTDEYEWRGVFAKSKTQPPQYSYSFICAKSAKRACVKLKHRHGGDYRGELSHTLQGVTCQKWSSQWPHSHTVKLGPDGIGDHNFCRNPQDKRRKRPWCFTTKSRTEWSYCDVTPCTTNNLKI